jgi:hypothetical protein
LFRVEARAKIHYLTPHAREMRDSSFEKWNAAPGGISEI